MTPKVSHTLQIFITFAASARAQQEYTTLENLPYRSGEPTEYMREWCKLDLYYPEGKKDFATVVWFHGGGLKKGNKSVPKQLQSKGIAVVAVNYRLNLQV